MIKVIMCPTDRAPYVTNISDSLENLQKIVGGYIEAVTFAEDAVLVCNEEGRLLCLPENGSAPWPGIVGDCFICGTNGEEFTDLADEPRKFLLQCCRERWKRNG